jgi:hypothetical protein
VANAGPDQNVQVGLVATLDGSESYAKTPALLTYQWTLSSQPKTSIATLANATTVRPTITPDVAGTYSANLVVNNGGLLSQTDSVILTAAAGDLAPIANAGPDRTVTPGTVVTMNGAGSTDPDGQPITTYAWTITQRPAKSAALLLNAATSAPSFTGDVRGTYKLSLIVGDGAKTSAADQVDITVATGNIVPVANAGPDQNPPTGKVVTLDGNGSADANGNAITHNWRFESLPAGSTTTLTNGTTATPTFTPDFVGFYVLALVVNDGLASSPLDFVVIDARLPSFVNSVLQAYVKASNTEANDHFGRSVALNGDTLAVGTSDEDSCADGINGDQADNGCVNSGAVYVFTRTGTTWSQQAYIKASNSEFADFFGSSVALSGDTLAVGAGSSAIGGGEASCADGINGDQTDNGCTQSGAVYVFTRTAGVWTQQAYVKASNSGAVDRFGGSVALSGDTLAVGAGDEDSCADGIGGDQADNGCPGSGAVYVFTRTAGVWTQQAYVKASNSESGDVFGWSVALSGDTLAVGASDEASCADGINGDQADNGCPQSGAGYVFTRAGTTWTQQAYVKASNSEAVDRFGGSVALSGDTLAVGALGEGSCATGIGGNQADNGCVNSGAVYVFTRTGSTWNQQAYVKASNTEVGDGFGFSVALSGDTLAVGAPGEGSCATGIGGNQNNGCTASGAVYVYEKQ